MNTLASKEPADDRRSSRSFVRREGRITSAQRHALDVLWPQYGLDGHGDAIDRVAVFGRHAPLELEIGCGNGDALIEMATARPEHDFIGIEVYRPGVGKLLKGIAEAELDNVRIVNHDAVEFIGERIAPTSIKRVMVYFPDPWPKKRHHKRRLLNSSFIGLVAERLEPDEQLHIATDWQEYAEFIMQNVSQEPLLCNTCGTGNFAPRPSSRPLTRFEQRGQRLGHEVFDIVTVRIP